MSEGEENEPQRGKRENADTMGVVPYVTIARLRMGWLCWSDQRRKGLFDPMPASAFSRRSIARVYALKNPDRETGATSMRPN